MLGDEAAGIGLVAADRIAAPVEDLGGERRRARGRSSCRSGRRARCRAASRPWPPRTGRGHRVAVDQHGDAERRTGRRRAAAGARVVGLVDQIDAGERLLDRRAGRRRSPRSPRRCARSCRGRRRRAPSGCWHRSAARRRTSWGRARRARGSRRARRAGNWPGAAARRARRPPARTARRRRCPRSGGSPARVEPRGGEEVVADSSSRYAAN